MTSSSPGLGRPRALYKVEDAAALLSVSKTRIYELIRSGQLESVTVGRSRRVPSLAVDRYVERLMRGSGHDDAA
jgi:excisionase family DNA binding protein